MMDDLDNIDVSAVFAGNSLDAFDIGEGTACLFH